MPEMCRVAEWVPPPVANPVEDTVLYSTADPALRILYGTVSHEALTTTSTLAATIRRAYKVLDQYTEKRAAVIAHGVFAPTTTSESILAVINTHAAATLQVGPHQVAMPPASFALVWGGSHPVFFHPATFSVPPFFLLLGPPTPSSQ